MYWRHDHACADCGHYCVRIVAQCAFEHWWNWQNKLFKAVATAIIADSSDSVDLSIILPNSVSNNPTSPFKLSADISAAGNISVQNFSGLLTLTDNAGNISVKGGLVDEGSCLQTHVGNTTFDGSLT